jgi:hypothetical protein
MNSVEQKARLNLAIISIHYIAIAALIMYIYDGIKPGDPYLILQK